MSVHKSAAEVHGVGSACLPSVWKGVGGLCHDVCRAAQLQKRVSISSEAFLIGGEQAVGELFAWPSVDAEVEGHEAVILDADGAVVVIYR